MVRKPFFDFGYVPLERPLHHIIVDAPAIAKSLLNFKTFMLRMTSLLCLMRVVHHAPFLYLLFVLWAPHTKLTASEKASVHLVSKGGDNLMMFLSILIMIQIVVGIHKEYKQRTFPVVMYLWFAVGFVRIYARFTTILGPAPPITSYPTNSWTTLGDFEACHPSLAHPLYLVATSPQLWQSAIHKGAFLVHKAHALPIYSRLHLFSCLGRLVVDLEAGWPLDVKCSLEELGKEGPASHKPRRG